MSAARMSAPRMSAPRMRSALWHLAFAARPVAALVLLLAILLAGCAAKPSLPAAVSPQAGAPDVQATAAAQATQIIQQAQATALILQANAQATAMVAEVVPVNDISQEPEETPAPGSTRATPQPQTTGAATVESPDVEILRVGFAADGGFIMVSFKAEPKIADTFWPGQLSITEESSGTIYNEVPVMPKIGPMISRPAVQGQVGYIMFVNTPPGLKPGSYVTVILGKYTFEHLLVE